MNPKIISRIAPTPSGFLHAGNVYNFLLTYLFMRAFDGVLHLRIDDYDLPRYRREYVENIFRVLEMLDIDFDGGPGGVEEFETKFSSKFRLGAYQNALKKLESGGLCYACECSHSMKDSFKDGIYAQVCANKNLKFKKNETAVRLRVGDAQIQVGQNLINFDALRAGETANFLENLANFSSMDGAKFGGKKPGSCETADGSKDFLDLINLNGEQICAEQKSAKFSTKNLSKNIVSNDVLSNSLVANELKFEGFGIKSQNGTSNLKVAEFGADKNGLKIGPETMTGNVESIAPEAEKFAQTQNVNLARILGDFVVWKKDDTSAYNLASLVDDENLGVNLLVRGWDLLACSAAQKYAAGVLGYDFAGANFIHHGLLSRDGKKLSKSSRAPAVSVKEGAKIHYKFAALKLGLDASKCDSLSNLLEMFRRKFKI